MIAVFAFTALNFQHFSTIWYLLASNSNPESVGCWEFLSALPSLSLPL